MLSSTDVQLLVVRARDDLVGLPIESVGETLRPLARTQVSGAPAFVVGASVVRGRVTPLVDLAALLGGPALDAPRRLITLRVGDRSVGLLVDEVVGVRSVSAEDLAALPPLLRAAGGAISALGRLDRELLVVLESGRLIDAAAAAPG